MRDIDLHLPCAVVLNIAQPKASARSARAESGISSTPNIISPPAAHPLSVSAAPVASAVAPIPRAATMRSSKDGSPLLTPRTIGRRATENERKHKVMDNQGTLACATWKCFIDVNAFPC